MDDYAVQHHAFSAVERAWHKHKAAGLADRPLRDARAMAEWCMMHCEHFDRDRIGCDLFGSPCKFHEHWLARLIRKGCEHYQENK